MQVKGSLWIITLAAFVALVTMIAFSSDLYAKSEGQVHLQQESMMQFFENTFQEEPSVIIPSGSDTVIVKGESIETEDTSQEDLIVIIPSASDAVRLSTTVLDNLSLSVVHGNPKYATNWKFGATVHTDWTGESKVLYTVTADY